MLGPEAQYVPYSSGSSLEGDEWQTWESKLEEAKDHTPMIKHIEKIKARHRPFWRLIKLDYVPSYRVPHQGPAWSFEARVIFFVSGKRS